MVRNLIIKKDIEGLGLVDGTKRILEFKLITLGVGEVVSETVSLDIETVYYVLSGKGRVGAGEYGREVGKGDIIYIPPEDVISIQQVGNDPLHVLRVSVDASEEIKIPGDREGFA